MELFTEENKKWFDSFLIDWNSRNGQAYTYIEWDQLSSDMKYGVVLAHYDILGYNGYAFAGNKIGSQEKKYYYRINGERDQQKEHDSLKEAQGALLVELNNLANGI